MMPLFKINKCKIRLLTSVVQRGPQRMKCSPQFKLFILFSAADVDFEFKQVNNTFQVFRIFPNQGFQYRTSPYKRRRAEWTENTLPAKISVSVKQLHSLSLSLSFPPSLCFYSWMKTRHKSSNFNSWWYTLVIISCIIKYKILPGIPYYRGFIELTVVDL